MDFRFSQEQIEIAEGVEAFLNGEVTRERMRALVENSAEVEDLWPAIAELGALALMVRDDNGGLGLGPCEFVLIAEAAGRVALPEPLVETAGLIAPALSSLGYDGLCDILAGARRITLYHDANPFLNAPVPCDLILICNEQRIDVVDWSRIDLSPRPSIDPLRSLYAPTFDLDASTPLAEGGDAQEVNRTVFASGAVFTAAELLGLSVGMIDQATEYAKQREQFGAPIGSFQAVKHHLASAFVKLEFARPLVYRAAASLSEFDATQDAAISQAKLAATQAAIFAAEAAIQVHGAMGYTYEVDLHLWMKRAWALAGLWGDACFHERRLDEALFSGAIALGPDQTFQTQNSNPKH